MNGLRIREEDKRFVPVPEAVKDEYGPEWEDVTKDYMPSQQYKEDEWEDVTHEYKEEIAPPRQIAPEQVRGLKPPTRQPEKKRPWLEEPIEPILGTTAEEALMVPLQVLRGTQELAAGVGAGIQWLGNRLDNKIIKEAGEKLSDYYRKEAEKIGQPKSIAGKNVFDDPELLANPSYWIANTAQMAPSLAAAMIPAVGAAKTIQVAGQALNLTPALVARLASLGAAATGGAVGGAMEGAQTYQTMLDEGADEKEAARAGELMTLFAGTLNAVGINRVLAKAGNTLKAKVIQKLGAGAWEGVTEGLEEPSEVISKLLAKHLTGQELPGKEEIGDMFFESMKAGLTVLGPAALTGVGAATAFKAPPPTDEPIDLLDVVESGDKSLLKSIKADAKKGLITPDQLQEIRDEFSQRYPKSTQELQDLDKLIKAQAQVQPIDLTEVVEEGAIPLEERVSLPKRGIEGPTIIEGAPVVSPEEEMLIKPAEEPYFEKQMKWAEEKVGKPEEEIEQPVIEMGRAYRARPEEVAEEEIIPSEEGVVALSGKAKPEEVGKVIPEEAKEPYLMSKEEFNEWFRQKEAEMGRAFLKGRAEDTHIRSIQQAISEGKITSHPDYPELARPEPTTQEIDQAAQETETEPTEAQIEAGNYKKGHIALYGFDISIENPKGSVRSGVDRQGKKWSQKLKHHYGYLRETVGKDKDHLDVFIGPNPESGKVFVIDQVDPETGKFDEHKIMMAFPTVQQARVGYLANYERAWKGLGDITELTVDEFKEWTEEGDTTKPIKVAEVAKLPPTEVKKVLPVKEKVEEGLIGVNEEGENVYEDEDRNRYLIEDGVKTSAPRPIMPTGQKSTPLTPKVLFERYSTQYLTKEEVAEFRGEKKPEEPALKPPVIDVIESPRLEWESFLKRLSDEDTKLVAHLIPKETPANVKAQIAFIKKELTKPPKEPIIKEKEVEEGAKEKPGILRRPGEEPLEGAPPEYVPEVEGERPIGERPLGRPEEDFGGYDESDIRARPEGVRGLGDGEGEIRPSPERGRPAELGRQHSSGRNYRITDADALEEGGPVAKYDRNIVAINLLKKIEGENRPATPEEQVTLAKYVGWGGLPEAFDLPAHYREEGSYTPKEKRAKDLEDLLTDEEYESARKSTPNAHFTSPLVINHIYDALKWMGFDGGRILEPSMGIGHFFGRMPGDWKTKLIGIELDSISGRIAKLLYPDADVRVQGYEETKLPNNFFDLAVSNVPFGDYKVYDPDYAKLKFFIHDYFFAKSLDKVRPGGLVAFITSSGMMNKKDARIRKYIAERAELIAAIRLPNNTFKKIANTEVTTDIVFLRKLKEGEKPKGAAWLETKSWEIPDGDLPINEYFHRYPHMQLGKVVMDKLHYGRAGLESDGRDLGEALKEAIETAIPTGLYEKIKHKATIEPKVADMVPAPEHIKNFAFFEKDKKIFQKKGDEAVAAEIGKGQYGRMKALINLRDKVRETLHNQLENKEELLKSDLKSLNQLYDGFVKNYGFIHESTNVKLFEGDPDRPLLLSLENWDSDKKTATKTDIFRQRTMAKYVPLEKADTAQDALIATIFDRGRIDFAHMSKISGKTQSALKEELKGLIFLDPEKNGWQTAEEYLSGNVRAKLEAAKAAAEMDPKYKGNVEALKKAQPEDKKPSQITARLGANWIPETDIGDFLNHLLKAKGYKPRYIPATSQWVLERKTYPRVDEILNEQKWGIPDVDALSLITDALNGKIPTVYTWITVEGKDKKVINRQKTILAQAKQQEIKEEFERWIWEETERRDRLAKIYNEKFNNIRLRKYDAQHLPDRLPGMAIGVELRPHQKDNIWRIVQGKNTLLAQVVGSGKTLSMSGAAMELRRLGLAKKPMFVVPKHLLKSWESEFLKFYPAAKILVPEEKSLTPQERAEFMARITTGDWDAVVITHPNMLKLPVSKKVQNDFIRGQIAELEDAIHAEEDLEPAGYGRRPPKSRTVKELEKAKNRLDEKLHNLLAGGEKDTGVTFEELGVDYMFIDESHNFKNLWFSTRMTRVAGVQSSDVEKTTDLFLKSRYLTKLNNGRGVVFATGTPISNSMAEMYTIQRYLDMDALKELDIHNFDAWAATFGEITAELEVTPTGAGFRVHTRFRNFVNVDQLSTLFRDFADVLHSEDLPHLPVPKVKDGKPKTVKADISPEQKEYVKDLEARMERIRSGAVDPSEDNALVVTGDGTKAALDMRLINPTLADNPGSKVNLMVHNALDIYKSTAKTKSTQLIFCDFSTPKKGVFNVYHDVRDKLIKAGVPKEEIAFIHDYPKDEQKMMLFQKVRQGDIRILMGSSKKMGEGMNVQNGIVAVHHLDAPWTPASVEQRDGRAIRPGNENEEVGIYRYVTQSTFDAYRWQLLENKAKFIGQAMKGGLDTVEDIGKTVIDYATAKAIAADNPIVMEKVKVESDLRKYQAMHQGWRDQRYSSQRNIETQEYYQSASQQRIEKIKADLKSREPKPEDKDFSISFQAVEEPGIKQGIYTDKKQVGQILVKIFDTPFERLLKNRVDTVDLFSYRGFAFDFSQTAGFEKGDIRNRIYFGKSVVRIELNSPDTYASKETAASAYFTTINNAIDGLEQDLKAEQYSLAKTKKKAEDLTQWLKDNPDFEHMDKLKELQKRVDGINAELRQTDRAVEEVPEVVPGQYYKGTEEGYTPIKGKKIEVMPWVDTFIHKLDDDTWAISESTSGLQITGHHSTQEKAKDAAWDILNRQGQEKIKKLVGEHIEKHGPSPWVSVDESTLVSTITDTLKDERGSISFERMNKDHPAVFDNLVTIGTDVIREGHTKYSDFAKQMRDKFSEIWDKIRNIMMRVWRAASAKLKEETGAIGGVKAIGAPTGALVKAQDMLAKGVDEKAVWKETGWMKGVEGKWKFEIDDSGAKFNSKKLEFTHDEGVKTKTVMLSELLQHPDLFKAYPQFRNILTRVALDFNAKTSTGSFHPGIDRSAEGLTDLEPEIRIEVKSLADIKATLLHEIQHAIQEIEGFARGGRPEAMIREIVTTEGRYLEETNKTFKELGDKLDHLYFEGDLDSQKVKTYQRQRQEILDKHMEAKYPDMEGTPEYEMYKRLAGEIEAREVAIRKGLTPEFRRLLPPYAAEMIPREDWIVREGKGTSFSIYYKETKIKPEDRQWAKDYLDKLTKETDKEKVIARGKKQEETLKEIPKEEDRPKEASPYEKEEDDWFGNKDWAQQVHTVEAGKIQDAIKTILNKNRYDKDAQNIDQAIHIYLDIKRNPGHVDEYYDELTDDQKKIINLAATIEDNPGLMKVAEYISEQYEKVGQIAKSQNVIFNILDNYVARAWKIPKKLSTDVMQKFKTTSRHAKHRVFETILEGQAKGFELEVTGASNNLELLKDEISRTIEDKRLISTLRKTEWKDTGNPIIIHKQIEGYEEIKHPNFTYWVPEARIKHGDTKVYGPKFRAQTNWGAIKEGNTRATKLFDSEETAKLWLKDRDDADKFRIEKREYLWRREPLYAPEEIAKRLNKILGVSKLKGLGPIDTITKYNAVFKSTILLTSLFHHQAFIRSYLLGTRHKTLAEWNPFKMYKEGLKAINELRPEIELLVRNGLTLGKMQDWEENILRQEDTIIGKVLEKTHYTKAFKDWANEMRERQAKFLFQSFGAGLKAQAALIEYRNMMKEQPDLEPNERAKMVAELINDDFGGLHLRRMGRDPTTQHIFRLLALAPDWCVPEDTRAMTKTGWKYHNELSLGDEILAFDPKTKKLNWSPLKDKYVNENYVGKMIEIKNFNRSVMMTPEHTCYVYNSTTKRNDIVKASELQTNHQIPRCADFDLSAEETYSDTYIELAGWFVTDGYTKTSINILSDGTKKEYKYGKITQSKPDMVAVLQKYGMKEHSDSGYCNHDKFNANHYKHTFTIPVEYFERIQEDGLCEGLNWEFLSKLTKRQLQLLYDTMMLGDGTGQKRFCGKEKEVFYMTLIQTMLGLPSTFYQQEENCWRTRWITRGKGISCWGHHNNKVETAYSGTIWCPSVATGFWLAEREGLMFITGNTESNVNTMWKAFRAGDAAKTHFYRRFWASVATKGLTAMVIANILLSFTDEDDLIERFKKAWKAGHFRWLDIDVTPIYKLLGGKSEARKYFSIFGHFRDPMKFIIHPIRSAKHKGSVFFRMFFEALTGTDWKGHRFTSFDELLGYDDKGLYVTETKEHKIGEPKGGRMRGEVVTRRYGKEGPIGWSQIPSYMIHQLRAVTPVQVQNFLGWSQGEIEAFDAIGRSIGAHVGSTYPTERKITEDFVNQWIEIKRARGSFKDLKKKVNEYNERQLLRGEKGIPVSWSTISKKGINIIKAERASEKNVVNY